MKVVWINFYNCRVFVLLLVVSILNGCTTVEINKEATDLMPRPVAMAIFEKHSLTAWAENPYWHSKRSCGHRTEYIEFKDIESAIYCKNKHVLMLGNHASLLFPCKRRKAIITNVSMQEAEELTSAARALGGIEIDGLLVFACSSKAASNR